MKPKVLASAGLVYSIVALGIGTAEVPKLILALVVLAAAPLGQLVVASYVAGVLLGLIAVPAIGVPLLIV